MRLKTWQAVIVTFLVGFYGLPVVALNLARLLEVSVTQDGKAGLMFAGGFVGGLAALMLAIHRIEYDDERGRR